MTGNEAITKILEIKVNYDDAITKIGAYKRNIESAREVEKQLKEDLENSIITRKEYNETLAATETYIKSQKQAITELSGYMTKLIKAKQDTISKSAEMAQSLAKLAQNYDNLGKEEREYANQMAAHKGKIDELKNAESELKRLLDSGTISREKYNQMVQGCEVGIRKENAAMQALTTEFRKKQNVEQQEVGSLNQLRNTLSLLTKEYDNLSRADRESLKGEELKKRINSITTELKEAEEGTQRFYRNVGNYQEAASSLTIIQEKARDLGNVLIGALGGFSTASFAASCKEVGMAFDDQMAKVQAVTNATAAEFKMMEDEALRLGGSTRYTATEAGEALENLSRNGLNAADSTAALEKVLRMAQANAMGLAETADIATNTMNAFHLSVDDMTRVSDVLSQTASHSATNVSQLAEAMKNSAPIAYTLGLSLEETSAAIGALADSGIKGSDAGSALRMALQALTKGTAKQVATLKELGVEITEQTIKEEGLLGTMQKLKDTGILASGHAIETLTKLFGRSAPAALTLMNSLDKMTLHLKENGDAAGATARMFDQSYSDVSNALKGMESAWEAFQITIYKSNSGGLVTPIELLTEGIRFATEHLDVLGKVLVGVIGAFSFSKVFNAALAETEVFSSSIIAKAEATTAEVNRLEEQQVAIQRECEQLKTMAAKTSGTERELIEKKLTVKKAQLKETETKLFKAKEAEVAATAQASAYTTGSAWERAMLTAKAGVLTFAATAKAAIRGILISTGIGALIAGVMALADAFFSSSDAAEESAKKMTDSIQEASKNIREQYDVIANGMSTYEQRKKSLDEILRAMKDNGIASQATISSLETEAEKLRYVNEHREELIKLLEQEAAARANAEMVAEARKKLVEEAQSQSTDIGIGGLDDGVEQAIQHQMAGVLAQYAETKAELQRQFEEGMINDAEMRAKGIEAWKQAMAEAQKAANDKSYDLTDSQKGELISEMQTQLHDMKGAAEDYANSLQTADLIQKQYNTSVETATTKSGNLKSKFDESAQTLQKASTHLEDLKKKLEDATKAGEDTGKIQDEIKDTERVIYDAKAKISQVLSEMNDDNTFMITAEIEANSDAYMEDMEKNQGLYEELIAFIKDNPGEFEGDITMFEEAFDRCMADVDEFHRTGEKPVNFNADIKDFMVRAQGAKSYLDKFPRNISSALSLKLVGIGAINTAVKGINKIIEGLNKISGMNFGLLNEIKVDNKGDVGSDFVTEYNNKHNPGSSDSGSDDGGGGGKTPKTPKSTKKTGKKGGKKGGKSDAEKEAEKEAARLKKLEEERSKLELEAKKKSEELITKAMKDGKEKQLKVVTDSYNAEKAAIEKKLADDDKLEEKEKKLTPAAREALQQQLVSLEEIYNQQVADINKNYSEENFKNQEEVIKAKLDAVKKGSNEEINLKKEQLKLQRDIDLDDLNRSALTEEQKAEVRLAIWQKYNNDMQTLRMQQAAADVEAAEKLLDQQIRLMELENDQSREAQEKKLQAKIDAADRELQILQDANQKALEELERRKQEENMLEEQYLQEKQAIQEKYQEEELETKERKAEREKELADYEKSIGQAKLEAASQITGGLIKLTNAIGQSNKGFAQLSKVLTLAQIAIDTGKAISAGIASASSMPYPSNLAAIATTVATVLANIATAISTVNSAKFAHGGIVDGHGRRNLNDEVLIRANDGEMVLNVEEQARAHRMLTGDSSPFFDTRKQNELFGLVNGTISAPGDYSPLTSSFKEIGAVPPLSARNISSNVSASDDLATRIVDGVENMPAPVVAVEDINDGQRRVSVIENIDSF